MLCHGNGKLSYRHRACPVGFTFANRHTDQRTVGRSDARHARAEKPRLPLWSTVPK